MNRQTDLTELFNDYAAVSLGPEPENLARFYAPSFLAAGPKGSATFDNDDAFLAWLRQVHDFNAQSGMTAMEAVGVDETPMGDDFVMATVRWASRFRQTGDEPIEFEISYVLHLTDAGARIVAYISHEDQEAVMTQRGLLPET